MPLPLSNPAPLTAVIWDFDGTLADTSRRNLNVTRALVARVTGKAPGGFPALNSLAAFQEAHDGVGNWREFYAACFGFEAVTIDRMGGLWTEYQFRDSTPVTIFPGLARVLRFSRFCPHGIVSQNSRSNMLRILETAGLQTFFGSIIGYEEVDLRRQKPHPEGLLRGLEELTDGVPGTVLYIGDHESDIRCAINANALLRQQDRPVRVVSVAATYGYGTDSAAWSVTPDVTAPRVADLTGIIARCAAGVRE